MNLQIQRHISYFIEKQRSAVGKLNFAGRAALSGAGESALNVAEQLTVDKLSRHRRAVERNERPAAPWARVMDRLGKQLLARAGFTEDEHAAVASGDTLRLINGIGKAVGKADEIIEAVLCDIGACFCRGGTSLGDLGVGQMVVSLKVFCEQVRVAGHEENVSDDLVGAVNFLDFYIIGTDLEHDTVKLIECFIGRIKLQQIEKGATEVPKRCSDDLIILETLANQNIVADVNDGVIFVRRYIAQSVLSDEKIDDRVVHKVVGV